MNLNNIFTNLDGLCKRVYEPLILNKNAGTWGAAIAGKLWTREIDKTTLAISSWNPDSPNDVCMQTRRTKDRVNGAYKNFESTHKALASANVSLENSVNELDAALQEASRQKNTDALKEIVQRAKPIASCLKTSLITWEKVHAYYAAKKSEEVMGPLTQEENKQKELLNRLNCIIALAAHPPREMNAELLRIHNTFAIELTSERISIVQSRLLPLFALFAEMEGQAKSQPGFSEALQEKCADVFPYLKDKSRLLAIPHSVFSISGIQKDGVEVMVNFTGQTETLKMNLQQDPFGRLLSVFENWEEGEFKPLATQIARRIRENAPESTRALFF